MQPGNSRGCRGGERGAKCHAGRKNAAQDDKRRDITERAEKRNHADRECVGEGRFKHGIQLCALQLYRSVLNFSERADAKDEHACDPAHEQDGLAWTVKRAVNRDAEGQRYSAEQ